MRQLQVVVHAIAEDGLPDMDADGLVGLAGKVAFIFDGCIVSGWPTGEVEDGEALWEADTDVGHNQSFYGVTHWVEFPEPLWNP
jgi:hypothetical protein